MKALAPTRSRSMPARARGGTGNNGGDAAVSQEHGNTAAQQDLSGQEVGGPFEQPWLNDALSACFGMSLSGISAQFGADRENNACNALAATQGSDMQFSSGLNMGGMDPLALEIAAHETAHALGTPGAKKDAVDTAGDPGEASALHTGKAFRKWAETGFTGPAPQLRPAHGGQAEIQRYSTSPSALTGSPMLRYGSRGDLVKTLQSVLNARGYNLSVDGDFGPRTQSAVVSFQRAHGLGADGIVGPKTAAAFQSSSGGSSSTSTGSSSGGSSSSSGSVLLGDPVIRYGGNGSLVRTLQTLLNSKGASLTVDGDFGRMTQTAVMAFQRANNLEVDGVVGTKTAAALNSATSNNISSGGSFSVGDYSDMRDAIIAAAESHLGAPYYWGADGPSMFDCSGFVLYILRQETGLIDWPDDTAAGISYRVPQASRPDRGDLVFYRGTSGISHIEFATGLGSQTIGASGGGSSTRGNDPNARVKYGDWGRDSRTKTYGSIAGLIDNYLKRKKS